MKKLLFTLLLISSLSTLFAQSGFKYQAVVRDNAGAILANQAVGFQMSIVQTTINGAIVYTETHAVTSNAFGMVNLTIGTGTVTLGTFSAIDWSLDSFLKVEMDANGGTSYVTMGTSTIANVPKALYAEKAGGLASNFGIYVTDYGAVGDGTTDDATAFQNALNAAETNGKKVFVPAANYRINSTISIPKGVMMIGEGTGNNPLINAVNGSNIYYYGSSAAISMTGSNSGIRDLNVIDKGATATHGIYIKADGEAVESLRFFNVFLAGFVAGTALQLEATNDGGIFYCSFYNVRVRNAKVGIRIYETASNAYVNSNTFHHGAVSGGGFDYCLWVDGGNNNNFYGTIFEPYTSAIGHIVVEEGSIDCHNIRIEAINQPSSRPVIELKADSEHCYFSGFYAGGMVLDRGNNRVEFQSGKGTQFAHSRENRFENASFEGLHNSSMPYWNISGAGVTIEVADPELTEEHNVLKLTIPAGVLCEVRQEFTNMPAANTNLGLYEEHTFGAHVKTNIADIVYLTSQSPSGVVTSSIYNGDDTWQFLGMLSITDLTTTLVPKIVINNTTGSSVVVYISNPTLNFGQIVPKLEPKPISTAGGIVTGTLSTGLYEIDAVPGTGFLVLPKYGNVFKMNGTQTISRINHTTADRFPRGTVITLLFTDASQNVTNSGYVILKSGYTSVAGSSLTLISLGDGTWQELSRNL